MMACVSADRAKRVNEVLRSLAEAAGPPQEPPAWWRFRASRRYRRHLDALDTYWEVWDIEQRRQRAV